MKHIGISHILRRFREDTRGAALVELAISLPLVLLIFASIVEGSRMLWAYQAASAGVRDASRYLARVAPRDICNGSTPSVAGYTAQLSGIISQKADGTDLFPVGMTVNSVTPSLNCVTGTYRFGTASVAQVSANITITMPFAGLFGFAGQTMPAITTTITDQSRIFGS